MKKSILFVIATIAILAIIGYVQSVYAIDLDLINSVRQNEIISAENLILDDNNVTQQNVTTATDTNTVDNTIVNNVVSNTVLDNTTAKPQVNEVENTLAPTTTVTTNYNTSSNTLSIGNILSILLIVVGFLLLLLGIAILIRMKR